MGDYRPKIEQRLLRQLGRMSALLLLALVQTALMPALWSFRIDLVLVVVVGWTLLQGLGAGLRWALYGGIALGLLSPLPMGTHLLALLCATTAIAVLTDAFPHDNRLVPTASVICASLLYTAIVGAIMSMAGRPVAWNAYPVTVMVPAALANGAAAIPVSLVLGRWSSRGQPDVHWEL